MKVQQNSIPWKAPFDKSKLLGMVFVCISFGAFDLFTAQRAWLSDDAFITLRTVDNFVHGYGLVWNVGERVQSYTHPFWMFLISAFYAITHEPYFTTITLSIIISSLAAFVLVFLVARTPVIGALGLVCLSLSGAFLDYSTGGLENPLTHLLIVIFAWIYFTQPETSKRLFWLSLVASLGAFNRPDAILLFLPALVFSFFRIRSWRNLGGLILGQLPLILWELFSLIYYGFLFPNTAYAKLSNSIPAMDLVFQGLKYIKFTLIYDPATLFCILTGLFILLILPNRSRSVAFALGILFYAGYVIKIGGDFMGGRFLTAPLMCSVLLLVQYPFKLSRPIPALILVGPMLLLAAIASIPPWQVYSLSARDFINEDKVADERAYYFPSNGILSGKDWSKLPVHVWRDEGMNIRDSKDKVRTIVNAGMIGYYAGPNVYLIDELALCDPLLARLPPDLSNGWRIGHFRRIIPAGYEDTLKTGQIAFKNEKLGQYYSILRQIIRGPIWNVQRWQEIIKINLGIYDYLLR
jgi:arabinofuranosyltransferase